MFQTNSVCLFHMTCRCDGRRVVPSFRHCLGGAEHESPNQVVWVLCSFPFHHTKGHRSDLILQDSPPLQQAVIMSNNRNGSAKGDIAEGDIASWIPENLRQYLPAAPVAPVSKTAGIPPKPKQQFKCPKPDCRLPFDTQADLHKHQKTNCHWRCVECKNDYLDEEALTVHNSSVSAGISQFSPFCKFYDLERGSADHFSNTSPTPITLKRHVRAFFQIIKPHSN